MHVAAYNGDVNLLRKLISSGGDINVTNIDGATLLHSACQGISDSTGTWECVGYLLKTNLEKAKPDLNYPFKEDCMSVKPRDILNSIDLSYGRMYDDLVKNLLKDYVEYSN